MDLSKWQTGLLKLTVYRKDGIFRGTLPTNKKTPRGDPDSEQAELSPRPLTQALSYRSALSDGGIGGGIVGADVIGARADEAVVIMLLDDMCSPTGDTADGEDRREEVDVDA